MKYILLLVQKLIWIFTRTVYSMDETFNRSLKSLSINSVSLKSPKQIRYMKSNFNVFQRKLFEKRSKQSYTALIHCLQLIVKHPLDSCFVAFQTTPENMIRNKEWRNDPNVCNFSRIFHGNLLVINNILCCASPCKVLRLIDLLDYLLRPT